MNTARRVEHDIGATRERIEKAARARRVGHAAVGANDVRAGKARRDTAFELRRQCDFRHQHQRLAALGENGVDRSQIDLGLAAAGNAVKQHDVEVVTADDGVHRRLLRRQQLRQRRRRGCTDS